MDTKTITTGTGTLTVAGMREALALANKKAEKAAERAKKQRAAKVEQLTRLVEGYENAKGEWRQNPGLIPESVRPGNEGELVGGKAHKGWVVEVRCEECGEIFLANTQDAFQKRFCSDTCKPKKASTATGSKQAREILATYSVEELTAMLAEAEEAEADEAEAVAVAS